MIRAALLSVVRIHSWIFLGSKEPKEPKNRLLGTHTTSITVRQKECQEPEEKTNPDNQLLSLFNACLIVFHQLHPFPPGSQFGPALWV